jgi:uncharacterized protein
MNIFSRKTFYLFGVLTIISLVFGIWAYFFEPNRLVINKTELKISNWNEKLNGLKIVVISDIHGGSNGVTEEKIRLIVEKVNEQDADIVALLGDYVSQQNADRSQLKMPIETVAENLRGLKAKYGVYAVLGNHDGWYNDKKIADELKKIGINVLESETVILEINGQKLRILGLKDQLKIKNSWEEFSQQTKTLIASTEGQGNLIVLEHSPDILPIITGDLSISPDLKLILAGHTHGGQVWFPVLGSLIVPSSYGQKYAFGHVKENNVDMFVTTGIGESILPIRFGVPPEIAVLTINSEN